MLTLLVKPRSAVIGLAALALSSCAQIPDMGALGQPSAALSPSASLGKNDAALPSDHWWRAYGDSQLDTLIETGLKHSPSLAEAKARVLKAQAMAQQAGAGQLPSISANGNLQEVRQSYNNGIPPAFVPKGFNETAQATLNFDYEIDFWGRNSAIVAAATSEAKAATLESQQAQLILTTSIASSYADLARLYEERDAAEESVRVRSKTAQLFGERRTIGLENESGVAGARSNQAMAEANLAAIDESIGLMRNRLATLVGTPPSQAIILQRPHMKAMVTLATPTLIEADLIARRPDIQASVLRMEAAAKRIDVARTGFYPNINLTGYIGHQSFGLSDFFKGSSLIGSVGPAIHLPLFEGGLLEGQYRGARADYDAELAQYEGAMLQALQEVSDAVTSQQALAQRMDKTTEAVKTAKRAYNVTYGRYRGGLATYLEVLQAEDALIATRQSLASLHTRAFTLDVALNKALGGGYQTAATE